MPLVRVHPFGDSSAAAVINTDLVGSLVLDGHVKDFHGDLVPKYKVLNLEGQVIASVGEKGLNDIVRASQPITPATPGFWQLRFLEQGSAMSISASHVIGWRGKDPVTPNEHDPVSNEVIRAILAPDGYLYYEYQDSPKFHIGQVEDALNFIGANSLESWGLPDVVKELLGGDRWELERQAAKPAPSAKPALSLVPQNSPAAPAPAPAAPAPASVSAPSAPKSSPLAGVQPSWQGQPVPPAQQPPAGRPAKNYTVAKTSFSDGAQQYLNVTLMGAGGKRVELRFLRNASTPQIAQRWDQALAAFAIACGKPVFSDTDELVGCRLPLHGDIPKVITNADTILKALGQ